MTAYRLRLDDVDSAPDVPEGWTASIHDDTEQENLITAAFGKTAQDALVSLARDPQFPRE